MTIDEDLENIKQALIKSASSYTLSPSNQDRVVGLVVADLEPYVRALVENMYSSYRREMERVVAEINRTRSETSEG